MFRTCTTEIKFTLNYMYLKSILGVSNKQMFTVNQLLFMTTLFNNLQLFVIHWIGSCLLFCIKAVVNAVAMSIVNITT